MRTVGAMHCAQIAWAQCGRLSVGGSEILNLVPHILRGTILDILRANEAMSNWCVFKFTLLGVGALIFHMYDAQCVLIWITFGWFALGGALLRYRGEHL